MKWQGSVSELEEFMQNLNSNNFNIKLTHKVGRSNMAFLDPPFEFLTYPDSDQKYPMRAILESKTSMLKRRGF